MNATGVGELRHPSTAVSSGGSGVNMAEMRARLAAVKSSSNGSGQRKGDGQRKSMTAMRAKLAKLKLDVKGKSDG